MLQKIVFLLFDILLLICVRDTTKMIKENRFNHLQMVVAIKSILKVYDENSNLCTYVLTYIVI